MMRFLRKLFALKASTLAEFETLARSLSCQKISVKLALVISGSPLFGTATFQYTLKHLAETATGRWVVFDETLFSREGMGVSHPPNSADSILLGRHGMKRAEVLKLSFPECTVEAVLPDGQRVTEAMHKTFRRRFADS